ncbi:NAD-dependent epimerase/dehydratase family protein [Rheinheimera aquimaris]|uniref:NAD-dependent epimerase/dehydratase family protein n=1 Tax=Rheinheimera aquimaris TaxID=412437 RepID=UPI001E35ED51|nr:NAD-dependent epimerase/dehydratase family protein [Rheinheimera aquimaris]MCD1599749.1 NAD-dependent epimerase/dehydratase family protein [Rheinheimera aquimaris]
MGKKILVLGGGGFIGAHLVAALNQSEHKIQVAGNHLVPELNSNITYVVGELTIDLYQRFTAPDIIFHLAGSASVASSLQDPIHDFAKTLPNLSALLHKMQTEWPQARLIYLSSAAVYGENASASTSVKCPLKPMSPYGLHKHLAEEMIQFYVHRYQLEAQIVRPFSVYGEGLRKQLLWDALNKAQRGEFNYFGTGEQQRDWVYIGDLIDFLLNLLTQQVNEQNQLLNAGTGEGIAIKQILTLLLKIAGYQQQPEFSLIGKPGDPDDLVACYQEQIVYPQLKHTSLQQGLERYIAWFKQQGQL